MILGIRHGPVPAQPRCGGIPGPAAQAATERQARSAVGDLQERRSVFAQAIGAMRASRSGALGKDSALRRWGLAKTEGGKKATLRAIVAVARKLSVLLHQLWVSGEFYKPFPEMG